MPSFKGKLITAFYSQKFCDMLHVCSLVCRLTANICWLFFSAGTCWRRMDSSSAVPRQWTVLELWGWRRCWAQATQLWPSCVTAGWGTWASSKMTTTCLSWIWNQVQLDHSVSALNRKRILSGLQLLVLISVWSPLCQLEFTQVWGLDAPRSIWSRIWDIAFLEIEQVIGAEEVSYPHSIFGFLPYLKIEE